jgi:hypothetical protein
MAVHAGLGCLADEPHGQRVPVGLALAGLDGGQRGQHHPGDHPDDEEGDADQHQRRDQHHRAVDGDRDVPLAGLEPATCCLGDVSAQTLCSSEKWLVSSDRGAKVIGSSDRRELSRYPTRTPSAAIGHVHRTVDVRLERAAHGQASRPQGDRSYGGPYAGHWRTPRRPDGHSHWYG